MAVHPGRYNNSRKKRTPGGIKERHANDSVYHAKYEWDSAAKLPGTV